MLNSLSKINVFALLLVLSTVVFTGCKDDDDSPVPFPDTKVYDLKSVADPDIEGTATFVRINDRTTSITIVLSGTPVGGVHPAHIHANTAAEGGPIVISLNPVNGTTGTSTTIVQRDDEGNAVSFEDLMEYDGHLNVHLSQDQLDVIVAQADIGQNELTGESTEYELEEAAVPGISGSVTFEERKNGEALATIMLEGTPEGGVHPAHIHMNSVEEGGGIVFTFNPVNGTTGMSMTNVAELDDGTPFGYEDVLHYDGHVNVHLSPEQLEVYVAQGNIGTNAE
ncbi:CHRD domain-containing protein [Pontibacter litorisediminis]|uniref:CHRD domain-containing protein n=1 Tax=Pontibacter litorisediminis TaxID=1846260 RepID=UPI0023EC98E5|nr:CHRD domain-containing protein [Pontibacter litorisediminis]